ncbi:unnamed protein product [Ambrosiozyma monospora]|uniref:Unnamed protein product n=1 Tax=Ambrosiozyma monospora TaxID=43982 RepID=A0ACB5U9E4_AMBMO|nr:unnamed protein product [Ambrosiozyma monospora]
MPYTSTAAVRGYDVADDSKPYECETCGKSYTKRDRLKKHIEVKHTTNIQLFICNECSKEYCSDDDLQRHLLIHTVRYKCPYCGKRHDRRDRYERHVQKCIQNAGLLPA